jgi:hypothetical protein
LLLAVAEYAALYVLGTNIAWVLQRTDDGRLGKLVEWARRRSDQLWVNDMLRVAYYLLGPFLILSGGYASLLEFGLADLDWIQGVGFTLGIGAGSLPLLWLLWWQYLRLVRDQEPMQQALWLLLPLGWAFVLREAILIESWWALIRSPMLLLAGPYFGVYLGLALVTAISLLNPYLRNEMRTEGRREGLVLTASLAVVTSTLYIFARNLWLCIALHFVMRMAVLKLVLVRMASQGVAKAS